MCALRALICTLVVISTSALVTVAKQNDHSEVGVSSQGQFLQRWPFSSPDQKSGPFRQQTNGSTPTGWIQLGTPKKWLLTIFDTGSDKLVAKTWESVSAELERIDQGITGMVAPTDLIYNHASSSSYRHLYMNDTATGKLVPRGSQITYGSGQVLTDDGTESVLIGGRSLDNFTVMEITADSLSLMHTSTGVAGILGLQHMKNKSLGSSLFSDMRDADLLTSFGYCRGTADNGTMIWGDESTEGQKLDVFGQMHWAVKLGGLNVQTQADATEGSAALLEQAESALADLKQHDPDMAEQIAKALKAIKDGDVGGPDMAGQISEALKDIKDGSIQTNLSSEDVSDQISKALKAIKDGDIKLNFSNANFSSEDVSDQISKALKAFKDGDIKLNFSSANFSSEDISEQISKALKAIKDGDLKLNFSSVNLSSEDVGEQISKALKAIKVGDIKADLSSEDAGEQISKTLQAIKDGAKEANFSSEDAGEQVSKTLKAIMTGAKEANFSSEDVGDLISKTLKTVMDGAKKVNFSSEDADDQISKTLQAVRDGAKKAKFSSEDVGEQVSKTLKAIMTGAKEAHFSSDDAGDLVSKTLKAVMDGAEKANDSSEDAGGDGDALLLSVGRPDMTAEKISKELKAMMDDANKANDGSDDAVGDGDQVVVDTGAGDGDGDGSGGDAMKVVIDPNSGGGDISGQIADKIRAIMKKLQPMVPKAVALEDACPDEKCTAILDTGSNIIAGPKGAIMTITQKVGVKPDCSNFDELPHIELTLGGMPVSIPPSGYVMKVPVPKGQQLPGAGALIEQDEFLMRRKAEKRVLFQKTASKARSPNHQLWKSVFDDLHEKSGVDLREQVDRIFEQNEPSTTSPKFLCMPALVPLDKQTVNGPLWIVGTPLLDAYYARWSFGKNASSPEIHLKALADTEVCKTEDTEAASTPAMLQNSVRRGPAERRAEEITYPHWAKDLVHV